MKLHSKRKKTVWQKLDRWMLEIGLKLMHSPGWIMYYIRTFWVIALLGIAWLEYKLIIAAINNPAWRETNVIMAIIFFFVIYKIVKLSKLVWSKELKSTLDLLNMNTTDSFLEATVGQIIKKK